MGLPQFDLFSTPKVQTTVLRDIVTDHRPLSVLSSKTYLDFEFQLAEDEYLLFNETYLYLKCKINATKAGGRLNEEEWASVKPVNYMLNTMFKQVTVHIGHVQVTPSSGNFGYKAYIEGLLGYTYDARTAHLSGALWNEHSAKRNAYINEGEPFDLMGRLHLDLTHQERALIGGVKIAIRLYTNSNSFIFEHAAGLTVDYEILDAYLEVHRSVVSDELLKQHKSKIIKNPATYPFSLSECKNLSLQVGTVDASLENVFTGQLPRRLFFSMVSNKAYNGDILLDPYDFEHYDLSFFACYIDGRQYPQNGYNPDFSKGLCVREYLGLMRALNQNDIDSVCNMAYEDYKDKRIILALNFAPDLSNGIDAEGKTNKINYGSLRIKLRFAKPLPEAVTAIVYAEFDSKLIIDSDRNASTTYM